MECIWCWSSHHFAQWGDTCAVLCALPLCNSDIHQQHFRVLYVIIHIFIICTCDMKIAYENCQCGVVSMFLVLTKSRPLLVLHVFQCFTIFQLDSFCFSIDVSKMSHAPFGLFLLVFSYLVDLFCCGQTLIMRVRWFCSCILLLGE